MTISFTFRTGDRNSSWISTKLCMMNENKLVMSPIVWYHGPVITSVQVDWFLEQKVIFQQVSLLKGGVTLYFEKIEKFHFIVYPDRKSSQDSKSAIRI